VYLYVFVCVSAQACVRGGDVRSRDEQTLEHLSCLTQYCLSVRPFTNGLKSTESLLRTGVTSKKLFDFIE